jgi:hypothetical protein
VLRADPQPAKGKLVFHCDPTVPACNSPDLHLQVLTIELRGANSGQLRTTFALEKEGKPAASSVFLFERKQ